MGQRLSPLTEYAEQENRRRNGNIAGLMSLAVSLVFSPVCCVSGVLVSDSIRRMMIRVPVEVVYLSIAISILVPLVTLIWLSVEGRPGRTWAAIGLVISLITWGAMLLFGALVARAVPFGVHKF